MLIAFWALPLAAALALGVARLLAAMSDAAGARALDFAALGVGLLWVIVLAALVSLLAVDRLRDRE